ncbi:hypothetical protein CSKR_111159 [Clonorchis sinensis]|uniref:Uncharacterized protein n=1 Tax=Clonorchis sinensis TaxID=79923 RepID=A0A419Q3G1_CLOSI|nr:hypothetical protein CSKR_111159 [Clonorchis sinensis]
MEVHSAATTHKIDENSAWPTTGLAFLGRTSTTTVFYMDVSLPYYHSLFKILVMKERIKVGAYTSKHSFRQAGWKLTTRTPPTWVNNHILQSLQLGPVGIKRTPSRKVSLTGSAQTFCDLFHFPLPGQRSTTLCSRHTGLGTENNTVFCKRWLGLRITLSNQRSFCFVNSGALFPIVSLWILRHQPPQAMARRQCTAQTLEICTLAPSVTLQSELIQHPRYTESSITSSANLWTQSGVFGDYISRSIILNFLGARSMPLVSSSNSLCAFLSFSKTTT